MNFCSRQDSLWDLSDLIFPLSENVWQVHNLRGDFIIVHPFSPMIPNNADRRMNTKQRGGIMEALEGEAMSSSLSVPTAPTGLLSLPRRRRGLETRPGA